MMSLSNAVKALFGVAFLLVCSQTALAQSVTCLVDIARLKVPNHTMVNVGYSYAYADFKTVTSQTVKVYSNEPANGLGDGNTPVDAANAANGKVLELRSERSGRGKGRIYLIIVTVVGTDAGNIVVTKSCAVAVFVAHSNSKASVASASAAAAKAQSDGIPLAFDITP